MSWRDATVGKALTLCISQHSLEERNLQNKHTLKDLGAGEVAQQLSAMFSSMAPGTDTRPEKLDPVDWAFG